MSFKKVAPFQQNVLRTTLAMGCACVSLLLPGAASLDLPGMDPRETAEMFHVAGPLTVFFVVYFRFNPASWNASKKRSGDHP
jgi:hypothetical protein